MGRWSSERARAIVFLVVLASLGIGAQAANAAAPASTGFTWSVPPLISRQAGPDGLSEYATPPAEVGKRRWPVRLQASGPCVATETYQWDASGLPEISGRGRCVAVEVFPREGTYGVTLRSTLNGREVMHSGQVTVRNWLIVVLGDSVASGEGNPDVPGARGARWQDRRCHRSANAGVAIAARIDSDVRPARARRPAHWWKRALRFRFGIAVRVRKTGYATKGRAPTSWNDSNKTANRGESTAPGSIRRLGTLLLRAVEALATTAASIWD